MKRLNGTDAYLFFTEHTSVPNHTLKIAILDCNEMPGGFSFDWYLKTFSERLHRLPPFRWRVVPTPLGLHQPLFVEDPDFDLENHVSRAVVPSPGGMRELCELISEVTSEPLNMERPLWQLWVMEGLEDGRVATVFKVHHTIADGVASARLLLQACNAEPGAGVPPPDEPWQPGPLPSWGARVGKALVDLPGTFMREIPRNYRAIKTTRAGRAAQKAAGQEVNVPSPANLPKTPFNAALTGPRSFAAVSVPLAEIKAVGKTFGFTINDVFLAIVSGGLRRYLKDHNALPSEPLVGGMPMTIRIGEEKQQAYGNRTTMSYVFLHTDIDDPLERLQACHDAATAAKIDFQSKGAAEGSHLANWLELTPPFLARVAGRAVRKRAGSTSLGGNVIVSNVPGPREPLYFDRARIDQWFSIGMVVEGSGLNITTWSYVDQFNISLLACRELVPDLWGFVDHMKQSLQELKELAETHKAA